MDKNAQSTVTLPLPPRLEKKGTESFDSRVLDANSKQLQTMAKRKTIKKNNFQKNVKLDTQKQSEKGSPLPFLTAC